MELKNGVRLRGIRPEMVVGLTVCERVFSARGFTFVVTSVNDSKHSLTSLHYQGAAVDLRTLHGAVPEGEREGLVASLRGALGTDFDVVLESDHIHVEYQPRG